MIGYLQGEILEHSDGKMIIGVGDRKTSHTVGYSVSVPQTMGYTSLFPGALIELFIHTHVREEALDLYGFAAKSEKALFLTLLNVNGIGPKSALAILSSAEPYQLIEAIVNEDLAFLTKLPGIGKKTAERILVELKDGIKKKVEQGYFSTAKGALGIPSAGAASSIESGSEKGATPIDAVLLRDAKAGLTSLGYREEVVHSLLLKIVRTSSTVMQRPEDLVKAALRQLASSSAL